MKRKLTALLLALVMALALTGCDSSDYKEATALYEEGKFDEALVIFTELGDYEDSAQMVLACKYGKAAALMEAGDYEAAIAAFEALGDIGDSVEKVLECKYRIAVECYDSGDYLAAMERFTELGEYKDSADYRLESLWIALHDYIEANGENLGSTTKLEYKNDKGVTYLATVATNPDQLILYSATGTNLVFFKSQSDLAITLTRGSNVGEYRMSSESTTTVDGKSGGTNGSASGTVDLGTITASTVLERSNYSYVTRDIWGNVMTYSAPRNVELTDCQSRLPVILNDIPKILEQTGLGITLQDLGFTALT